MEAYISTIQEELECKVINIGGFSIHESVIATLLISVILLAVGLLLTSGLRVENPSRRQLAVEAFVTWLQRFFEGPLGPRGKRYVPYMMTIACYVGLANIFYVFGIKPPTKDLTVTAALAVMSIALVQIAAIQTKGVKGWLHSFLEPMPAMLPMNILELFIKPVSLCMRLFGNMLGGFVVMELIKEVVPLIMPIPFSFYFDIFDGLLQAYVFVFLTALFMTEEME